VVNGFRLLRHVSTGSYGSVWQVESPKRPGRRFALKFSLHGPGDGSVGDARAVREVQLLLRAAHENVVRVVAHGRWEDPVEGLHYIVLEWVEGGTLWQWAHATRPSVRQAVRLCQKLARALQRAHDAGVLHRDIKPDNVLVRAVDGEPFLADFGVGAAQGAPTLTGGALPPGTLAFHSPQLLANHLPGAAPYRARPADDWYALGVLLYQLLTEVRPYPDEDQAQVLAQWVARCTPVAPHELNPRVPPALGQVALTLLSAEPHLRYPDGQAVCAALEQALATAPQPEASLRPPLPPPELIPTRPPSESDGPPARDEEVQTTHAFKDEQDPEEARLEQVESLRDMLLRDRKQRRPPRLLRRVARVARQSWGRPVAAAALLAAGVWGAWALGLRLTVAARAPPALTVASTPAPPAPPPVAASAASPHLAPLNASSPKEGSPVKTPPSPVAPPSTPVAGRPKTPKSSATRTAVCVSVITVGCSSVPLRPTQQQCPPEAVAAVKQRGWMKIFLDLDPNKGGRAAHLRPGPIISKAFKSFPDQLHPPTGSLLHGHVFFAEDGRVVVRYLEVELESGERVPICHAVVSAENSADVFERHNETENSVDASNGQVALFFRVLPD
jgi:serine/threonine-protein kinase